VRAARLYQQPLGATNPCFVRIIVSSSRSLLPSANFHGDKKRRAAENLTGVYRELTKRLTIAGPVPVRWYHS
jgi:hypothetical protein